MWCVALVTCQVGLTLWNIIHLYDISMKVVSKSDTLKISFCLRGQSLIGKVVIPRQSALGSLEGLHGQCLNLVSLECKQR